MWFLVCDAGHTWRVAKANYKGTCLASPEDITKFFTDAKQMSSREVCSKFMSLIRMFLKKNKFESQASKTLF